MWRAYWQCRSTENRNRLVLWFRPIVSFQVNQLLLKLFPHVTRGDIESWANEGLINAVETYNPTFGTRFKTYASRCIRWKVWDNMRLEDRAPRLLRCRSTKWARCEETLAQRLGRQPEAEEVRAFAKMDLPTFISRMMEFSTLVCSSLSSGKSFPEDEEGAGIEARLPDHREALPDTNAKSHEGFHGLLVGLNRNEKILILCYYVENWTMSNIGSLLGLSESRVSQMHTEILDRMRERLTR
jgi:RNA polymerase sigma factor FliA